LDRFFFKLLVPYSSRAELATILERTTTAVTPQAQAVVDAPTILTMRALARQVVIAEHVQDYAIRLVLATHPEGEFAVDITNKVVRFGASPRGVQALILAAKVRALLDERYHVSFADVQASAHAALRHRIMLNFEGQAEGLTTDSVIGDVLVNTPKTLDKEVNVPAG
jgi:MoxR-like ATPase